MFIASEDNQDGFDDAFSQFANPDKGAADPDPDEGADDGNDGDDGAAAEEDDEGAEGADGADAGADGDGAGDDDAAGAGDDNPDDGGDDGDPDAGDDRPGADDEDDDGAPPEDRADAILEGLSKLLDKQGKEPEADKAASQPQEESLYSADEEEFLKTYDEDWSDVTRGESLKRRAEYQQLLKHVFTEVSRVIAPLHETVGTLATRTHLQDIEGVVPDYDQLRDGVISWVEEQPAYLQAGMKQVIQAGTAEEVADLIGRYREATGTKPKGAAPKQTKQADLPEPAKKAAEALAPVSTKRSNIPQQDDPNDFDAAFRRFSSSS